MKTRIFFWCTCLLLASAAVAQPLIPYLGANGKYGYADPAGKLIYPPEFDTAPFMPSDSLGVRVTITRQPYFLLRNGLLLGGKADGTSYMLDYGDWQDTARTVDTLRHLWLAHVRGKAFLVDARTRDTQEYWPIRYYQMPNWFSYYALPEDRYMQFQYGFCRVYKGTAPGKKPRINFVNTRLQEIFSRDFPAGKVVDRQFVVLADDNRKMGVGDSSGRICVPLAWDKLQPTKRSGYFFVNNAELAAGNTWKERGGMIDADGKLVIDTVYRDLQAAGKDYIIVRRQFSAGVMDYTGKWVLPMQYMEISHVRGDYFIVKDSLRRVNVLNTKAEKQFPIDYSEIRVQGHDKPDKPLLELWEYPVVHMADAHFHILFSDTNAQSALLRFPKSVSNQFLTHKDTRGKPGRLYGVRDDTGKFVLPPVYDQIMLPADEANFYIVKKDKFFGLFDTQGREILPVKYVSIRPDEAELGKKITRIWAKPQEGKLYKAYDLTGKELPIPANFMPFIDRDYLVERVYERAEDREYLSLIDGSRVPMPEKGFPFYSMEHFRTPEGGFLVDRSDNMDFPTVYSAFLKKILPSGFVLPYQMVSAVRLKNTGLMTVYQTGAGFIPPSDYEDYFTYDWHPQRLPSGLTASGVIDATGKWVMPPKRDAHFLPMSHDLILEVKAGAGDQNQYVSHRVNPPGEKPVPVNYLAYSVFAEEARSNMLIQSVTDGFGYYNPMGERIISILVQDGPRSLRKRNLVRSLDKEGNILDLILDENGRILYEFGPNLEFSVTMEPVDEWDGCFVVATRRDNGFNGLLDSTGKTVLPFQYRYLKILQNNRLLSANSETDATNLLDWNGALVYAFPKNVSLTCYSAADGYLLLASDDLSLVISPQNKMLYTLPGRVFTQPMKPHGQYAALYDKQLKKAYWVHIPSGKTFREP